MLINMTMMMIVIIIPKLYWVISQIGSPVLGLLFAVHNKTEGILLNKLMVPKVIFHARNLKTERREAALPNERKMPAGPSESILVFSLLLCIIP